ncbi:BnaC06g31370D [Brassica napus]|uniref:(rape) hypothetical protein n=1 Tax=Brassica napus TaxID=3708 RepID=A0A078FF47_BRANA|nr:unnamed protein product [Brassica napus]CDY11602.1 BnaC06g31370D [Brassica napus]
MGQLTKLETVSKQNTIIAEFVRSEAETAVAETNGDDDDDDDDYERMSVVGTCWTYMQGVEDLDGSEEEEEEEE